MIPSGWRGFIQTRVRVTARPIARLLLALAGFVAWSLLQGLALEIIGFVRDFLLRYSIAGILSLVPVIIVWSLVKPSAGVFGVSGGVYVAAAGAALFIPFLVIAFRTGLAYQGFSVMWPAYAVALLALAAEEEIICRGFLMDVLSFRNRNLVGLLLSSLVFAMLHLGNNEASTAGLMNIFLAGALFGLIRIVTGGLLYPVLFHWLWNLMTGMVFGWSVSGHDPMPTIFTPVSAPPWGGFGPEESILMTIGTAGGIILMLRVLYLPDDKALRGIDPAS